MEDNGVKIQNQLDKMPHCAKTHRSATAGVLHISFCIVTSQEACPDQGCLQENLLTRYRGGKLHASHWGTKGKRSQHSLDYHTDRAADPDHRHHRPQAERSWRCAPVHSGARAQRGRGMEVGGIRDLVHGACRRDCQWGPHPRLRVHRGPWRRQMVTENSKRLVGAASQGGWCESHQLENGSHWPPTLPKWRLTVFRGGRGPGKEGAWSLCGRAPAGEDTGA